MSVAELPFISQTPARRTITVRKPLGKRLLMIVRRSHLYLGLFLLPWAVLYGVSAFLFNHPTAFADTTATRFGADAIRGTPMDGIPSPGATAAAVVAVLNERASDGANYTLVSDPPPAYSRDFVAASVKTDDGGTLTVFFDLTEPAGSIRGTPPQPKPKATEKAPFAIGVAGGQPGRGGRGGGQPNRAPKGEGKSVDGLKLPDPLPERVKAAVPAVLAHTGMPAGGEVSVPNVPDLTFRLTDETGKEWAATYNAATGGVAGKPAEVSDKEPMSWRRFLLRLHVAHGYPSSGGARWWWALVVDVMAFVMVFWGVSGLLMWWQLKSQRKLGIGLLGLSAVAATALGIGMYQVMR